MNVNKVSLLSRAVKRLPSAGVNTKRTLYTDSIYPYPHSYIHEKKFPGRVLYRENWPMPPWTAKHDAINKWSMRVFWTFWFLQLFNDPGALIGHHTFPDPTLWTDAELGIPPDDAGPYEGLEESLPE